MDELLQAYEASNVKLDELDRRMEQYGKAMVVCVAFTLVSAAFGIYMNQRLGWRFGTIALVVLAGLSLVLLSCSRISLRRTRQLRVERHSHLQALRS